MAPGAPASAAPRSRVRSPAPESGVGLRTLRVAGRSSPGHVCVGRRFIPDPPTKHEDEAMSRETGDRYVCEKCGAALVYEMACPCPPDMPHVEICCGQQMKKVGGK